MMTYLSATAAHRGTALLTLLALAVPATAHVDLNAPNGGEVLTSGDTFEIAWTVTVAHDTIGWDLFVSHDGSGGPWVPIALGLPPGPLVSGQILTYDWTVPAVPGTETFVRVVQDNGSQDYDDISNGAFTIQSPCTVTNYCSGATNSTGSGSVMSHAGSVSMAAADFELVADGAVPGQTGLFFYGAVQDQVPFGAGFRCVANPVFRLGPPIVVDGAGRAQRPVDFTAPPASSGPGLIDPLSTWNFQLWYRDPAGGSGGFNLSDGLSVTFCP